MWASIAKKGTEQDQQKPQQATLTSKNNTETRKSEKQIKDLCKKLLEDKHLYPKQGPNI